MTPNLAGMPQNQAGPLAQAAANPMAAPMSSPAQIAAPTAPGSSPMTTPSTLQQQSQGQGGAAQMILHLALLGPRVFANVVPGGKQFLNMLQQHNQLQQQMAMQGQTQTANRGQAMQGLPAGTMGPVPQGGIPAPSMAQGANPMAGNTPSMQAISQMLGSQ